MLSTLWGKIGLGFLVVSLISALSLGIYKKIVQPTTDNDYINTIKKAQQVIIDQRQIIIDRQDTFVLGKLFGIKFISIAGSLPDIKQMTEILQTSVPVVPKPKNPWIPILIVIASINLIAFIVILVYHLTAKKFQKMLCNLKSKSNSDCKEIGNSEVVKDKPVDLVKKE
jgi:hypothetical protein